MIDVERLLTDLGIEYQNGGTHNFKIFCINPEHPEKKPSMYVHKESCLVHCLGCFLPEAPIYTNTGIKKIDDISTADLVLTKDGSWKKVTATHTRIYTGEMVELTIAKHSNLFVSTGDHKVFVYPKENVFHGRYKSGIDIRKGTDVKNISILDNIVEKQANSVNIGDWVVCPKKYDQLVIDDYIEIDINKYKKVFGPRPRSIPNKIKITEDLMWLIGLYIAEGSYSRGSIFSLHKKEEYLYDKINNISKNIFGINCTIHYMSKRPNSIEVFLPNVLVGRWLQDICGSCSYLKHIPYSLMHCSPNLLESLLEGYYCGDGSSYSGTSKNTKVIITTSQTLAFQIKFLLNQIEIMASIYFRKAYTCKNGNNHKDAFTVRWTDNRSKKNGSFYFKEYALYKVLGKRTYNVESLSVNDLSIEDSHSYLAYGIAVHNCNFSGNVFTLLHYKGIYGIDVIAYLQKFAKEGYTEEEVRKALEQFVQSRGEHVEETVKYTDIELPIHRLIESNVYLEKRGITPEEMRKWSMAVVSNGRNVGWVLIPIYQGGILRNYFMRNTFGEGKLYGPYARNDILAGLDFIDSNDIIYVTEGIFDALAVNRAGFPTVACLSNRLLPAQLEHLKKFDEIVIVPDNDVRGLDLVNSAGPLIHTSKLKVCELPLDKKDAADCTTEKIKESCEYGFKWNDFMIKKKYLQKIS